MNVYQPSYSVVGFLLFKTRTNERRAEMSKYIRVPLTEAMERDYRECAEMMDNGQEKDCEGCSMNGGSRFECMGEYPWRKDEEDIQ